MAIDYDRYLARLKAKRLSNPEYEAQRRQTMQIIEPARAMTRQASGAFRQQGASFGAQAQMLQDNQAQMSNILGTVPSAADTSAIDDQIMNLEIQRDTERDAKKDAWLQTGLKVGGAALGAIAGSVIPGAGTLAGAAVGAGLGEVAAGFVGGGGKMGTEYVDPQQVEQGFADTVNGISSAVSLKKQKELSKRLGGSFSKLRDSGLMEPAYMAILSKDFDLLSSILDDADAWSPPTAGPETTNTQEPSGANPSIDNTSELQNTLDNISQQTNNVVELRDEINRRIEQGNVPGQTASFPAGLNAAISNYGTGSDSFYRGKFEAFLEAKRGNSSLTLDAWLANQNLSADVKNAMRGMWRNYGQ